MGEQPGVAGLDLDEFYGKPWDALVAQEEVRATEAMQRGPYSPEELAHLMAGAVLHPLDFGVQYIDTRPPIAA